jgi:signal transduction histidine kinase
MAHPGMKRSSLARSLDLSFGLLALSALAFGGIYLSLVPLTVETAWVHLLYVGVFWVYIAAGLLAWWRRPSNRMGALIVVGGFALFAGSLANTNTPGLEDAGVVLATMVLAVTVHLLHAFPSGRLRGWMSRATVLTTYFVSLVLQAPLYLFNATAPPALLLADRPDLLLMGVWVQRSVSYLAVAATIIILIARLRGADPVHRRVLAPLFAYGVLAVLFISLSSAVLRPLLGIPVLALAGVQLVIIGGVPVAFALGVLRGGFARTGELEELGTWLGSVGGAKPALAEALSRTLGDPGLEVVFWAADRGVHLDSEGAPVELPGAGSRRSFAEVELAGDRVGAIVYDAGMIADIELVRTAGRVVAIAVDRERLTAELLASEHALRRSRARLVDAAERERRRIARDLHDGAQMQLVLLAVEAQQVANAPGATAAIRERATVLRKGIDAAAGELRTLVHAVMPSSLIERGLSAAAEDLVDRMPVPTRLELGLIDGELPAAVESAAYFVLSEGLANAVKHSGAHSFAVRIVREGDLLLVEVHDDGIGGASPERGTGLRGLADRVDVIGGRLRVQSDPGRGTRLLAELPCVS